MIGQCDKPNRGSFIFELSASGYLRMSRADAEEFFPENTLVPMWKEGVLLLLPTRGAAGGGLMLKQRNKEGDRSVLIAEVFDFTIPEGQFTAVWDDTLGGLRVAFSEKENGEECLVHDEEPAEGSVPSPSEKERRCGVADHRSP